MHVLVHELSVYHLTSMCVLERARVTGVCVCCACVVHLVFIHEPIYRGPQKIIYFRPDELKVPFPRALLHCRLHSELLAIYYSYLY